MKKNYQGNRDKMIVVRLLMRTENIVPVTNSHKKKIENENFKLSWQKLIIFHIQQIILLHR